MTRKYFTSHKSASITTGLRDRLDRIDQIDASVDLVNEAYNVAMEHAVANQSVGARVAARRTREYLNLLPGQVGPCEICEQLCKLVGDHCHATGWARGRLCINCNAGLGMFKDNPQNLVRAVAYLAAHAVRSMPVVVPAEIVPRMRKLRRERPRTPLGFENGGVQDDCVYWKAPPVAASFGENGHG